MRATALFLICCLCISAYADTTANKVENKVEVTMDKQFLDEMAQIEQIDFGKTLMETIQLQVESHSPFEKLIGMLVAMKKQVKREKHIANHAHAVYVRACVKDFAFYKANILEQKSIVRASNFTLQTSLKERFHIKKVRKTQKVFLHNYRTALKNAVLLRRKEVFAFRFQMATLDNMQSAIRTARGYFVQVRSSRSSFLETSSPVFAQIKTALENGKSQVKSEGYQALLQVLQGMSTRVVAMTDKKAQGRVINTIISLCDRIIATIEAQRAGLVKMNNVARAAFRANRRRLRTLIRKTKARIAKLGARMRFLATRIEAMYTRMTMALKKLHQFRKLRKDRKASCALEQKNYVAANNIKKHNLFILRKLLKLLRTRHAHLVAYLKSRRRH